LALYLDMGLAGVAACPVATTGLSGALALYLTRKHVSWFGIATPSRSLLCRLSRLSLWFFAWSIVTRVAQASDLIVLGILGSVELVSSYALTKFASDSLVGLVAIVVSGSTPGLGGILGAGGLQQTSRVRSELMALTWLIATVVGVTIILWNQAFIGLWVGEEHYAGSAANLLITLKMIQWAFIQNDASIIDLTLDLRAKVLSSALSAMLSLAVAAILVGIFEMGIVGVCIGFIAGRSLLTVAYPFIVGRILGIAPSAQLAGLPRPITTTAALFGLAITLAPYLRTSSWIGLLLGVPPTVTLAALVASLAGLSRSQRARIPKRVSMMFRSEGGGRAAEQP
jgi:O-antigen/teichoic acid export membrane protein